MDVLKGEEGGSFKERKGKTCYVGGGPLRRRAPSCEIAAPLSRAARNRRAPQTCMIKERYDPFQKEEEEG